MKKFNVTAQCVPNMHYMVDLSEKLAQIKTLIDEKEYFTINRARQYGKTTTLRALKEYLSNEYLVVRLSFEKWDETYFENSKNFCAKFLKEVAKSLDTTDCTPEFAQKWIDESITDFSLLDDHLTALCKIERIVLMIDEIDHTSNNRIFLHFLSILRAKYIERRDGIGATFHSVILAGVHDIKNIKLKLINEGLYTPSEDEKKLYNSPWNIAADFEVDMSFSPDEISTMLIEYENDHHTGMDIPAIAKEIHEYTSGYPYLVSAICKRIDEKLGCDWSLAGIRSAIKLLLRDSSPLFTDLIKNIANNHDMKQLLYRILMQGRQIPFEIDDPVIGDAFMYGIVKSNNDENLMTVVSNRIFEIRISNYFISRSKTGTQIKERLDESRDTIIRSGRFDMKLCIEKFAEYYGELYNDRDVKFLERECRFLFLMYLKTLINGRGFYQFESQLADERRTDLLVEYGSEQFVIELKVWRGTAYQKDGYRQLVGYLKKMNMDTGYLISFQFLKDGESVKTQGYRNVEGKLIFEVVL